VFVASFTDAVEATTFQRFLASGGQVEPSQQIREAYEERMARSAARDKPISEPMIAELFTPRHAGDPKPATTIGELFTRLVVDGSARGYATPYCTRCHGSGSIDTGNNDLPCHCAAGDAAIFNSGGRQMTGAEIKAGR
jgi:hypothetical protein